MSAFDVDAANLEGSYKPKWGISQGEKFGPLLVLCCAACGFGIGLVWWAPTRVESVDDPPGLLRNRSPDNTAFSPVQPSREVNSIPLADVRELHLADVMLTHGNVAEALKAYNRLVPQGRQRSLHDQLLYRVCIAHETLGNDDLAAELYGTLAAQAQLPAFRSAAKVGQARIWLKTGRLQLARTMLASVALENAGRSPDELPTQGEIAHLFGLVHLGGTATCRDHPSTWEPKSSTRVGTLGSGQY